MRLQSKSGRPNYHKIKSLSKEPTPEVKIFRPDSITFLATDYYCDKIILSENSIIITDGHGLYFNQIEDWAFGCQILRSTPYVWYCPPADELFLSEIEGNCLYKEAVIVSRLF